METKGFLLDVLVDNDSKNVGDNVADHMAKEKDENNHSKSFQILLWAFYLRSDVVRDYSNKNKWS